MSEQNSGNSDTSSQSQHSSNTFDDKTFDEYAQLYEELANWPFRRQLELPALERGLGDLTGISLLDFGCGPGFFSRLLKDKGAAQVVGYDISEGMLAYARRREEKEHKDIRYVSSLDDSLTGKFDIVLAIYVLPYAPDQHQLLSICRSMSRVLKPGGRLLTLPLHPDFHPDAEYYRPYGFRLIEHQPRRDGGKVQLHLCMPPYDIYLDTYRWSAKTLQETFNQAGFGPIRWHPLQLPPALTSERDIAFLSPYVTRPHAAILESVKEG